MLIVVPGVTVGSIVALMVIVTDAPAASDPFQVTVLVPTFATAVPLVAVAETRSSVAGSTSINSSVGLFCCVDGPAFVTTIV